MIPTIVIAIIVLILIPVLWLKGEGGWGILGTIVAGFIVWLLLQTIITVAFYPTDGPHTVRTDIVQTDLKALSTSSTVTGSFFLGSGSVSGSPAYTYISTTNDGGFELKSIKTSQVIVYEIPSTESAYMETSHSSPDTNLWSIFYNPAKTRFYVPVGSVQNQEFSVTTDNN